LYSYADVLTPSAQITVNGHPVDYQIERGYAVITRNWQKGDVVELVLPMEVRRVAARPELRQDSNRIALQYGPLVCCIEAADNNGNVEKITVPQQAKFEVRYQPGLLGGINTICFDGAVAIPYYAWCNRGGDAMQVWLPQSPVQTPP
jgi:DUF1680 family protein